MADGNPYLKLAKLDGEAPRVLLAGGTPAQATVASILAEQFGCRIRYVGSPADLLGELQGSATADLVVLDQAHPHGAGALAVPSLEAETRRRGVPFIRLTGSAVRRPSRTDGVVSKPYSPRDLFAAMRTALAEAGAAVAPS